jgi:hypothetical protein
LVFAGFKNWYGIKLADQGIGNVILESATCPGNTHLG